MCECVLLSVPRHEPALSVRDKIDPSSGPIPTEIAILGIVFLFYALQYILFTKHKENTTF